MKILVGITGGIAAYKSIDVISGLQNMGNEVHVIMSDNAHNFCPSAAVNVISKGNLKTETPDQTIHIEESKWCDAFLLVPGTANTITKIAGGIADSFLLNTILALPDKIRIVCPAMNTNMWENPITQANIEKLRHYGWHVIFPVEGMLACGDLGIGKLPNTREIVEKVMEILNPYPKWNFPLKMKYIGANNNSNSFFDIDITKEVEVPIYPHVGAFGIRRRHDVHSGVDLYAPVGTEVYAVEFGKIVSIEPFTGKGADCDWWEDTWGVYVEGNSGIVVYGEIKPNPELKVGDRVDSDTLIGTVLRVLRKDKGRPTSMLHIELHKHGHINNPHWEVGGRRPEGLLDPTKHLIKSNK